MLASWVCQCVVRVPKGYSVDEYNIAYGWLFKAISSSVGKVGRIIPPPG
jgi:hypothetical protein